MAEADQFDVVVVGCGVAGLTAAVAAAEAGATVAVLERATRDERGGGTRWTTANLRMQNEDAVTDDFEDRLLATCGHHILPDFQAATVLDYENWPASVKALPFTDPELIAFFASAAAPTIAWLKMHGVRFGPHSFHGLAPRASPRIAISGGGLDLIETMAARAEQCGVRFFYETTATDLLISDSGSVGGIGAVERGNRPRRFVAGAVVLASGGFQGNMEMVIRYIGARGRYLRPVSRGSYYNKGEGIEMALRHGAAAAGDYAEYHAEPIDPRSSQPEPVVRIYPYGILLNRDGRRFIDEAPGPIELASEPISRAIASEKDGIAFCIFDEKVNRIDNWRRCVATDRPPETAGNIETLAEKLGFSSSGARATIDEYNRACVRGDFDPFKLDGLSTHRLLPGKSNYAVPIDTPPFYAYPIISSNTFTFGGLKVNVNAQVINRDGDAMPGLYAAGETVGLYYRDYPGATSVLRGAVFGRRAGQHAGSRANRQGPVA